MPICEHAAAGGHLEIVKWCRANGFPWGRSSVRAAEGGHFQVLIFCRQNNDCPWSEETVEAIARGGHLNILKWWRRKGSYGGSQTNKTTAVVGRVQDKKVWSCVSRRCPWPSNVCYEAARGGHLEVLQWLVANGCQRATDTMRGAVEARHLPMLMWCKATGFPWPETICRVAAGCGDLDILKWCVSNASEGSSEGPFLCAVAAAHGHLDTLKWCREIGCPWGHGVCFNAAQGGHFQVLKWCVANGCSWGGVKRVILPVLEGFLGDVEMMAWANSRGCLWMQDSLFHTRVCVLATAGGNLELLERYARPFSSNFRTILLYMARTAAYCGHLETLQWLQVHGGRFVGDTTLPLKGTRMSRGMRWEGFAGLDNGGKICEAAARSGKIEVVEWCLDQGYRATPNISFTAASRCDLEMLAWCKARGLPRCREPVRDARVLCALRAVDWTSPI